MKNGYSLIEMLIVLGLMGIVISIGLAGWTNYQDKKTLDEAGLSLVSQLRSIRSKAVRGEKPGDSISADCLCNSLEAYQVEESSGVLRSVPVCDGNELNNNVCIRNIEIDSGVNWSLSNNFRFKSLTGQTNSAGPFQINLIYYSIGGTVNVTNFGSTIEWQRNN
jgi:prepilin-type N-terminal cleavage/methylation domain-containing protein